VINLLAVAGSGEFLARESVVKAPVYEKCTGIKTLHRRSFPGLFYVCVLLSLIALPKANSAS